MVLLISAVMLGMLLLVAPLRRNGFYMLHMLIVIVVAWWVETTYFYDKNLPDFIVGWKSVALMFAVFHLISVNVVTFLAYGFDKRAAQKNYRRIPENQLHTLEFMGGWCGAILGQKFFHHKTKKASYQSFFWAMFIAEILVVYIILKYLRFI